MKDSIILRQDIIKTCQWLSSIGLVFGTWGNISVRLEQNLILMTPSRIDYDTMKHDDLVTIDIDGNIIDGHNHPTSEKEVHRNIYIKRPDINAIIHCHSAYAMAASIMGKEVPPITEEMCQLLGGGIPCTQRFIPSENHKELGIATAEALQNKNAVLIRNHGPVCCGGSLEEAKITCLVVEKSAKIYLTLKTQMEPESIPDEYVKAGREYYLFKYGKGK